MDLYSLSRAAVVWPFISTLDSEASRFFGPSGAGFAPVVWAADPGRVHRAYWESESRRGVAGPGSSWWPCASTRGGAGGRG